MRTWWRSQLPFFAFLLCFAAVAMVLISAGLLLKDSRELAFICDADNCVEDTRSWSERNAILLSCTAATVMTALVALISLRFRRAAAG